LLFFAHKKFSRRLINLRLSHCSHLDYFNDVFNNFSRPASIPQEAYGLVCRSDPALRFHQKYLTGLEQHEGEQILTEFSFLGELTL